MSNLYRNISAEGAQFGAIEFSDENPWATLVQAKQYNQVIQTMVTGMEQHRLNGSDQWCLIVDFQTKQGLIKGVIPKEASGFRNRDEMEEAVGRQLSFVVKEASRKDNLCILSRKEALEKMMTVTLNTVKVGDVRTAVVERVSHNQAVPNIGGVEALLARKEYSYNFVDDLSTILKPGDALEVQIIGTRAPRDSAGGEGHIFRVSIRQTKINPWDTVKNHYWIGGMYRGVVTGTADTGPWIDLGNGIDAMAPHPRDRVLSKGTEVLIKISSIDPKRERISAIVVKTLSDRTTSAG